MLYLIKETDINMHTAKDNPMPKHSIDKRIITYTRKARKLEKRIVKTTSHITLLDTCVEQNLIPKGFMLKWSPSFQETNGEGEKIQNILRHSSTRLILSSALKPGAHFFENNKITGVFTMFKLCVSKERLAY